MNAEQPTAPENEPAASASPSVQDNEKQRPQAANAERQSPSVADGARTSDAPSHPWQWLMKGLIQAGLFVAAVALALFVLGLAQRYQWITPDGLGPSGGQAAGGNNGPGAAQRYICPMMCVPPTSEPGRCPVCGMELVAATGADTGDGVSVSISPAARRLAGIETATSSLGQLSRTIRTIGSITYDESRLANISAYIDGRLEEMFVNFVGEQVAKGDDLALIYSPQLYTAQTELITSLESRSSENRFGLGDLSAVSRQNLIELGMTEEQIAELERTRTPTSRIRIKSPQSGTVIAKSAVEGEYLKTGQQIYRIADLTSVWLMLDVFPNDASLVRFGQEVEAELQSRPGEVYTGRVGFIDPVVNPQTRTVRVRVEFLNFDGSLRPGDYASARLTVPSVPMPQAYDPALAGKYISPMHPQVIRDEPGACPLCGMELIPTANFGYTAEPIDERNVVTIPRSAVLMAGEDSVVYVETEPGRFEIRRVSVGTMTSTTAGIVQGLVAGEQVATAGNFLIDSQMQLAGNPSLLDPTAAPSFPPGPLPLIPGTPTRLVGAPGQQLDRVYQSYFDIHRALAADVPPSSIVVNTLVGALRQLESSSAGSDAVRRHLGTARRAAAGLSDGLETARSSFRTLSHSLLPVAAEARGTDTPRLFHFYCPMVPGGGGDWLQSTDKLLNPYWGSEMLECGELVQELPPASEPPGSELPSTAASSPVETGEAITGIVHDIANERATQQAIRQ